MGAHGLRRFAETVVSTAVVVVVAQIVLRWLDHSGWLSGLHVTRNFEGYAGNRNAFAFQMLVCSILLLAYSPQYKRADRRSFLMIAAGGVGNASKKNMKACRVAGGGLRQFALLHGIVLAGLVFSASRAGLITGVILLASAWVARLADRRMIGLSVAFAILIWVLPQLMIGGLLAAGGVQSMFSVESSNLERWESITRGFGMWMDSPFLGAGLGVFIERSTEWFKKPLVIHSTPVWILAELGLVGMGVIILALVSLARVVHRGGMALPAHRIIVMLLLVFMVFGIVHEIFYQRIFWLVLGAALAVSGYVNPRHNPSPVSGHHG
jgi:hypothetical protein